ncbi:MAG: HEAT repeat domain-containing protein, partial [Nitrospira sp.]
MTTKMPYRVPVSCEDLRALFSRSSGARERPGVEQLGAFRGHLSRCGQCQATYGAQLDQLVQQAFTVTTVRGLGPEMSKSVEQILMSRLLHPDLCIRMAAVDALGTLGVMMSAAVQQALLERLEDPEWMIRMGAVKALSCLDTAMPADVRRALEARRMDRDEDVRETAVETLSRLDTAMPADVRRALADWDQAEKIAAEEPLNLRERMQLVGEKGEFHFHKQKQTHSETQDALPIEVTIKSEQPSAVPPAQSWWRHHSGWLAAASVAFVTIVAVLLGTEGKVRWSELDKLLPITSALWDTNVSQTQEATFQRHGFQGPDTVNVDPAMGKNLEWLYQQSIGVPQVDKKALVSYRKAAEQGDAWGQNNLGWMYQYGRGVPQDDQEAVVWYRKAAEQGNAWAQN